jgi:hypothetical protein
MDVGDHERTSLSGPEQQALAAIERELVRDDRRLARLLGDRLRISASVVVICLGVAILLVSCVMGSPVVILGVALVVFGLITVPIRVDLPVGGAAGGPGAHRLAPFPAHPGLGEQYAEGGEAEPGAGERGGGHAGG